jgi:hypothetical protein
MAESSGIAGSISFGGSRELLETMWLSPTIRFEQVKEVEEDFE